mmetsp:Transcript_5569/g.10582  ORF Transcript_5569/g.10582 Transcript_5569/m.10582 type:complete len:682 (-) Transcript_5569:443-2488(-)
MEQVWYTVETESTMLECSSSRTENSVLAIQASIPSPVIPIGLSSRPNFISELEAQRLLEFFDSNEHLWNHKGFEKRRREQHYHLEQKKEKDQNGELYWIVRRLMDHLGDNYEMPHELFVQERYSSAYVKEEKAGRLSANTFETLPMVDSPHCPCKVKRNDEENNGGDDTMLQCNNQRSSCSCYVAQITLVNKCIQSIDKPKERKVECWDMESEQHKFKFIMEPLDLYVKTGEALWNWRSHTTAFPIYSSSTEEPNLEKDSSNRVITLKFRYSTAPTNNVTPSHIISKQDQDEEKKEEQDVMNLCKDKPLEELLTIIVTTSPIKSNPSTEVLEKTFATFHHGGDNFAFLCPKVIVCDGCRIMSADNNVSKKYSNSKQSLRNGIATNDQAENYLKFKMALKNICKEAQHDCMSPFHNTRVVELEERHGYGFALRHALYHEVTTPYVCVIQHDRTFMRRTPMEEVVRSMIHRSNDIKYVGLNMRSNLTYRDIIVSKYGRGAGSEILDMVLYPPELALDANVYGPNGSSARNLEAKGKLKDNLDSLAQNYKGTIQGKTHISSSSREDGKYQLSLTPTLYWYDNIHVVETFHYRDYIFNPMYRMVVRGGFVEDKLSPIITKSVERLGLRQGHAKFKCYLLDDHSGYFFTGHLDGGSFMSQSEKDKIIVENQDVKCSPVSDDKAPKS